ncbi:MAG: polysaccharide deacetylase [Alphaproteobacteria bacterium]
MAITVFVTFDFDALWIWIGTFKQMTPTALSRGEEVEIMERAETALMQVVGVRPIGYRSPAWELSPDTIALLVEHGYRYDSSLTADDFRPYRPRRSDTVEADGEVCFGPEALLWEFPVAWELDDYPYFHFSHRPFNQGLRSPRGVEAIWLAEFEYCRAHLDHGVFTLTTHPEIIGRGFRIAMLERLIGAMKEADGIKFLTMSAAAAELDKRERHQTGVPQLRDRT